MKKAIYRGRIITLYKERVRLPNGRVAELDIIRHPGACAIIPVTDKGEIILVRQFRFAAGGYIYEIPAGTLKKNENPLSCARRELIEETGFAAKRWKKLISIKTTPGFTNEVIHIYLAKGLITKKMCHDFDEVMTVKKIPMAKIKKMILNGKIVDSKTLAGLFYYFLSRGEREMNT